jgi:exopolysaccharide biosynthesis predicted pyruvyltransferase EpsI
MARLEGVRPAPLDTRLDSRDWRLCSTAEAFMSLVPRLEVVVTTRLHGLVLALPAGVPALAIDPVAGGGKVTRRPGPWAGP